MKNEIQDNTHISSWIDQELKYFNMMNIMYTALSDKFGPEVDQIIKKALGGYIQKNWAMTAEKTGSNSLEEYIKNLFDPLPEKGWVFSKKTEDGKIFFRVTECPRVQQAKMLGAEKLMFLLTCEMDYFSASGFNDKIKFTRTKTLMQGCDCCDHTYELIK